jgi:hypothetical protein
MTHTRKRDTDSRALEELLIAKDCARILRVSDRTLSDWRYNKKGPAWMKLGRLIRYHPEDIAEYIEEARQ